MTGLGKRPGGQLHAPAVLGRARAWARGPGLALHAISARSTEKKKIEGRGSTAGPRSTARSSRCQYTGDACWCHVDAKVQPRTQGRHVERATPVAAPRFYFKYPSLKMHNFKKSQLT
jgi:hypothetical protein